VSDHTGTLTLGESRPVDLDRMTRQEKSIALALAQSSRHPLSRGLAGALRSLGVHPSALDRITEQAGEGVSGLDGSRPVALVRPQVTSGAHPACELRIGDKRILIDFTDPLRPDVADAVAALAALGLEVSILSGDARDAVAAVADWLALPFVAGVTPAEKLAYLAELEQRGKRVLMVGDGLNDGPALAAAHVSMAPGGASDVSRQAADAVFLGDSLMPVANAVRAARRTMRTVRQNFRLAVGYNVIAVPIAVAGFVTPLIAALAMSLSSLIVVGNSLRLTRGAR
jgi:Cu2+-exporting ATPase